MLLLCLERMKLAGQGIAEQPVQAEFTKISGAPGRFDGLAGRIDDRLREQRPPHHDLAGVFGRRFELEVLGHRHQTFVSQLSHSEVVLHLSHDDGRQVVFAARYCVNGDAGSRFGDTEIYIRA